ncbi:MAG: hypothetical protein Tsb0021_09150 [Chlamydiales bacterium]
MMLIAEIPKNALIAVGYFLNQPLAKEGIKGIAGCVTFVFGAIEIYDMYHILHDLKATSEAYVEYPKWVRIAHKIVIICTKISLILSAGVSRPGIYMISMLTRSIVSSYRLEQIFGPNTIFAVNPRHPRHIMSFVTVLLALPSVIQSTYKGSKWFFQNSQGGQSSENLQNGYRLTDARVRMMSVFNTFTSRPALHLANQIMKSNLR